MAKKPVKAAAKKVDKKETKKPAKVSAKPVAKAAAKPAALKVAAKPVAKATPEKKSEKASKPEKAEKVKAAAKPKLMAAAGKARPEVNEEAEEKQAEKQEPTFAEIAAKAKLTKLSELPEPPTAQSKSDDNVVPIKEEMRIPNRDVIWKPAPRIEVTASEESKKWVEFKTKYGKEKAPAYNMKNSYEVSRPIEHKTLGWGYILSIENDRLEVLFKEGRRMLISNYRPK